MARRKLERVKDLDISKSRLAAIKSISPSLDLGNGITATGFETSIENFSASLAAYNTVLSSVDELYNKCIANLSTMRDLNERVLSGVASKYGKNSNEYEMAGGKRKSEIKRTSKKTAA
jgi:hypothetical protein